MITLTRLFRTEQVLGSSNGLELELRQALEDVYAKIRNGTYGDDDEEDEDEEDEDENPL
jgi:hypothetical protein